MPRSSPRRSASMPLLMLPGDSGAAFYPLCGIAIFPCPPVPLELAAHEVEHSLTSATVAMHLQRALAEAVYSGISLIATMANMTGESPFPIVVPGFREPYVLGIRHLLLSGVSRLTLLPEEAYGA